MDGFLVSGVFRCKEMAWIDMDTMRIEREFFRVAHDKHILTARDWKQINFVSRRIHGMKFQDFETDADQQKIDLILLHLSAEAAARNGVIAFKGGNVEKKRLIDLEITKFCDIEKEMDCPKFEILIGRANNDIIERMNKLKCGRHKSIKKNSNYIIPHCPSQEVFLFALYLRSFYECIMEKNLLQDFGNENK
jgi:hypothetical protein